MKVQDLTLLGAALLIALAIFSSNHYTVTAAQGGEAGYAWRVNQWSGEIMLCKADPYKLWCRPIAPDGQ